MTRDRWVAARKAEGFPITMACTVAEVSRQVFHDWRARSAAGPTAREVAEAELVEVMREIHAESDATYGEPRMTEELAQRGRPVNHKRVPPGDPDFERLFPRRNDAESINRHLDDTMWLGRAHSIGHARQHLNLLGFALTVNSLALHRHQRHRAEPLAA